MAERTAIVTDWREIVIPLSLTVAVIAAAIVLAFG